MRPIEIPAKWRTRLLLVSVLAVSTVVIVRGIHKGEFNVNVDETIHATTGLYFADFFRDLPLRHPIQYTYRYYGQYPALGVVHWPPIFHIIEGLAFLLFGPSVIVARATVLLFALLAVFFEFRLVQYLEGDETAAIAAILLASLPAILLFEKAVMLEIPVLALSTGALYFWIRYLRTEVRRDAYWFASLASTALLIKQTAAFLLPVCFLALMLTKRGHLLFRRITWEAVAICALALSPYYLTMTYLHGRALFKSIGALHPVGLLTRAGFYWRVVPEQMGWLLFALSLLGFVIYWAHRESEKTALLGAWIVGCYVTFTAVGELASRFIIYWLPAWACLAAVAFTTRPQSKALGVLQRLTATVVIAVQLVWAWSYQRPNVTGYAEAARRVVAVAGSGYVLFDGPLPGNFIFFVRAADANRRIGVLRKALYATMIGKENGRELVHGADGIRDLLRRDGIRVIVVADNVPLDFRIQHTLRDLLDTGQFRLKAKFVVSGIHHMGPAPFLAVYENQRATPPADKYLHLKMLTLSHDLVVPLRTLGPVGNYSSAR